MAVPLMARRIEANYKRLCSFEGPGHNRIIMPGKPMLQVRSGDAQGDYHSQQCYRAALTKYQEIKKQLGLK